MKTITDIFMAVINLPNLMFRVNMLLIAMALFPGCQKHDINPAEITEVTFRLNVSPFSIDKTDFAIEDTIFDSFKHRYPIYEITTFRDENGNEVPQLSMDNTLSIEKQYYTLPIGTYTIQGDGGPLTKPNDFMSFMSYNIEPITVEITVDTKIIPVTLNPTCLLFLVADPYKAIDYNVQDVGFYVYKYTMGPDGVVISVYDHTSHLAKFNSNVSFLYIQNPNSGNNKKIFRFTKTDGTKVEIDIKDFQIGHIYRLFVNPSQTGGVTPASKDSANVNFPVTPVFVTETINFY